MKDAVITEMHQIKDAIAAEHGYDVRAIAAYARRKFPRRAKRVVRPAAKKKIRA
jgi:hypothetical protein